MTTTSITGRKLEQFNRRAAGICRTLHELCPDRLPLELRSMFCPEPGPGAGDPWHVHNYIEIRVSLGGVSEWETPEGNVEIAEGELLLIPATLFHRRKTGGTEAQPMGFRAYVPERFSGSPVWEKLGCAKFTLPRSVRRDISETLRLACSRHATGELQAAFLLGRVLTGICEQCLPVFAAVEPGPDEVKKGSWEFHSQVYQSALQYINDNLGRSLSVDEIAAHCFVSARHLTRIFLQVCGVTPGKKITRCRIDRAFILLSDFGNTIRETAAELGFADVPHFSRVFRQATGLTPNEYRKRLSALQGATGGNSRPDFHRPTQGKGSFHCIVPATFQL